MELAHVKVLDWANFGSIWQEFAEVDWESLSRSEDS